MFENINVIVNYSQEFTTEKGFDVAGDQVYNHLNNFD